MKSCSLAAARAGKLLAWHMARASLLVGAVDYLGETRPAAGVAALQKAILTSAS